MVAVTNPKTWFSDRRGRAVDPQPDDTIGILAFEAAAAMARLVSLQQSLSNERMLWLRSEAMRSHGVAYLNSTDQSLLLRLACAEIMEDLDRAVAVAARLGRRCRGAVPQDLGRIYASLKAGSADPRLVFKGLEKDAKRMWRYVEATARLYGEMEVLAELEAAERKLDYQWGRYSGPIPMQKPTPAPAHQEFVLDELKLQRQKVRRMKEESLWARSFDKAVGLMGRAACAVFARVCVVFGPFVPGLPPVVMSGGRSESSLLRFAPVHFKIRMYPRFTGKNSSGPLDQYRPVAKEAIIRHSSPLLVATKDSEPDWSKTLEPPAATVGGSGLALRYANVIVVAERLLRLRTAAEGMGAEERREEAAGRAELYEMLPVGLRAAVRGKLWEWWRKDPGPFDWSLADGWKEAAGRILGWLGPMARDTVQWQAERRMDRHQRFDARPRILMLQTLHFSDREKTEAAIVEVLVGLSCVGWYERRCSTSIRF